ncbi:hypothetical protein Cri9333_3252 [Crinalium epipsammum PCC 9333]|uniref:Uncharacterized protein n=1 Tax=Crinalium epipsammum PCC 9333 TaxID=1173022 RepID=K9W155_9CYAN|nr:hypothetical protein [Crinalium epipsammum]AFZ14083.1 hypothetical protein Cri9333_3252 [Crinalium epipsammum PCC 9333]
MEKKGLGWIPDYPDIRDYRTNQDKLIKKNGVVKKDEFTGAVEEIADKLIAVLNIIKNNQVSEQKDDNIEELVNSLQNKIFGNVSFITVKVRKILRQGSPPVKSNYFNPELTQFQANQILELKKYLYILVAKGLNTEVLKSPLVLEQGIDLDDPKELVKWLITNEFDETTKRLLMVFQCCADIKIDGILGLETYTALNEYFNAEPSKLQELGESQRPENKNKVNQILSGEISSPAETKVKLVSLPSLIPNEIFKVILDQLIKLEVVESDFYDNNSDDCLQEDFRAIILELTQFKWKKVFTPEKLQDFIDIAQKNFLFIEPIISLIINLTTPLAQFKSFEEAMEVGFKQLKPIINTSQTFTSGFISNSTINCLEDSKEYILSKVDAKKLAQLVQKMHARYYDSLNLLLRERKKPIDSNKLKDNASEIYFYVLLKKIYYGVQYYCFKARRTSRGVQYF